MESRLRENSFDSINYDEIPQWLGYDGHDDELDCHNQVELNDVLNDKVIVAPVWFATFEEAKKWAKQNPGAAFMSTSEGCFVKQESLSDGIC